MTMNVQITDPIFARIANHRAARELMQQLYDADGNDDRSPGYFEADALEIELWAELKATTPETIEGLSAFITYLATVDDIDAGTGVPDALCSIAKAWRALGLDPRLNEAADGEAA